MTAKRTKRTEKPLTIAQANEMAAGHAEVSVDPIDATLWRVEGDGWTEAHEPMGRAAFARLLADKCLSHDGSGCGEGSRAKAQVEREKIKTYAAKMPDGRTVRCTVPEDPTPDEVLFDAIKDNFSPQAVAAMAACLQAANTKNRRVNQQLTWFAGELVKCVR
ncbi:MAG: hypothetical protein BIFFINMI_04296 [Phycisphaerae bacterium]|nr:hypothetical protein [Phycisphaerae bacterium]